MVFCLLGQLFSAVRLVEFAFWEVTPFPPFTRCVSCSRLGEMTVEVDGSCPEPSEVFQIPRGGWDFFRIEPNLSRTCAFVGACERAYVTV